LSSTVARPVPGNADSLNWRARCHRFAGRVIPIRAIRRWQEALRTPSLRQSVDEQGLSTLYARLEAIVPDLRHQYTGLELNTDYLVRNVRSLHAFQVSMIERALDLVGRPQQPLTVVDVGDSAGTHLQYLRGLHPDRDLRCLSLNLDPAAVDKIKRLGMEAVCARAEELTALGIDADVFLSFETLEHLPDPIGFLQSLSLNTHGKALVVTVPYVAQSRVGMHHIRLGLPTQVTPENTHIFELSPADWRLLFRYSGWEVRYEQIYRQYPRRRLLRVMKRHWQRTDFEGFWGVVVERDSTWMNQYTRW